MPLSRLERRDVRLKIATSLNAHKQLNAITAPISRGEDKPPPPPRSAGSVALKRNVRVGDVREGKTFTNPPILELGYGGGVGVVLRQNGGQTLVKYYPHGEGKPVTHGIAPGSLVWYGGELPKNRG